jgi:hypothetical protein
MTMRKWIAVAAALWTLCAPAAAQNANQIINSVLPTDLIQIQRGNSGAIFYATPATVAGGGTSSLVGGTTTITGTCTSGNVLFNNSGVLGCQAAGGTGTVTSVSVTTANGISGTVATATTTPAITLALGAITPTSVALPATGAAGATVLNFGTAGTGIYGTSTLVEVSAVGALVGFFQTNQFNFSSTGASLAIATDTLLSRGGAAATWKLGASADSAAPVAQTLSVQNVVTGTSNTGGANFIFNASKSTGTGVGGKWTVQTTVTGTTGTAVNTNFPMLTLNPGGATTSTVQFGDGTNITTYDSCTGLTTGATGIVACAASALRFKTLRDAVTPEQASRGLDTLRTGAPTWDYLDPERYGAGTRVGLIADDVAAMDRRCVVERDGEVADYWDRCVIAYLVADRQKMKAETAELRRRLDRQ